MYKASFYQVRLAARQDNNKKSFDRGNGDNDNDDYCNDNDNNNKNKHQLEALGVCYRVSDTI